MITGRDSTRRAPNVTVVIVTVIVSLLAIEIGARALIYFRLNWTTDPRISADAYGDADWVRGYYREFRESGVSDWRSYVYWRRRRYAGTFINVDAAGIRRSWTPPELPPRANRVFVFGGSTVWGTGSRDEYTAPSQLGRVLAAGGRPVQVINFGESGYVMRQSVETLVTELLSGNRPAAVVFHLGVEDTFAVFQGSPPGTPQNETNRRVEFNALQADALGSQWQIVTAGSRLVGDTLRRRLLRPSGQTSGDRAGDDQATALLAHTCSVASVLRGLGREYGFEPVLVWQPILFTKRQQTSFERRATAEYQGAAPFFHTVYGQFRNGTGCAAATVHDLSTIVEDEAAPMFVDAFHLSEEGNRRLGAAIAPLVADAIDRARSRRP